MLDDDELSDLKTEFRTPRRGRCSDGFCGADDCARCFPSSPVDTENLEEA